MNSFCLHKFACRVHAHMNIIYPTCAHVYNVKEFSILARGHTSFHLSTLEATYIKTSKPNLCKQKEFVYDTTNFNK